MESKNYLTERKVVGHSGVYENIVIGQWVYHDRAMSRMAQSSHVSLEGNIGTVCT